MTGRQRLSLFSLVLMTTITTVGFAILSRGPLRAGDADPKQKILEGMTLPEYDARGGLIRPEGYERWTFIGTSLGIRYLETNDPPPKGPGDFHHVFIQPQAYEYYLRFGEFPEKTLFVMTNCAASKKSGPDLINKHGHFAGKATGLEVSVKDTEKFSESWAYFLFTTAGERKPSRALPQNLCYDCHAEHGQADNVFTQFYGMLEQARESHLKTARP
ncbi:cytochrome P460 family protein [bacterium]|nr:cytochrome P460 family protein [bacterium]